MKNEVLKYLSVFIAYFIVDVGYQFAFGMNFSQAVQEEAGIKDIFVQIYNTLFLSLYGLLS